MARKLIVVAMFVAFLATSSIAFAEDVHITKRGKKYHKQECLLIKNKETTALSKDKAIESGYAPCSRCFREDIIVENKDAVNEDVELKK